MRVLFRCDSTRHQGLGHLARCVAVAEAALAAGWEVVFCGEVRNALGLELLESRALRLVAAPEGTSGLADVAVELRADVVHVDSYADQTALLGELSERGILLSSVEDGQYGRRPADLVVDPSPTSERLHRPADGSGRLLRGAKAIPLRRSLLNARNIVDLKESLGPTVMVVMGGTDALGLTDDVTQLWIDSAAPGVCHVVSAQRPAAADRCGENQHLVWHEPSPEVPGLFGSMDLVISGAGTTTWELAALGVPVALIQLVDNQRDNYSFAVDSGFALGLGMVKDGRLLADGAAARLAEVLDDPSRLAALSSMGRSMVDGRGSERIVENWSRMIQAGDGPRAREATLDDASVLYDWRNDPSVRSVSRTGDELQWEAHLGWVQQTVTREDRTLLVVEQGNRPVGTVRFDHLGDEGDRFWEVSITVSPAMRGRGMAGAILAEGERYFRRSVPDSVLVAEMLETNQASYRLFRSAGYVGGLKPVSGGTEEQRWYQLRKSVQTADSTG